MPRSRPAHAADPNLARNLAATCANCHEGRDPNDPKKQHTREQKDKEWEYCVKMAMIARDLMVGNPALAAAGFTHGLFNMEFFHDAATDRITVIEFNPRMASQFSDLYLRVDGIDLHRVGAHFALSSVFEESAKKLPMSIAFFSAGSLAAW